MMYEIKINEEQIKKITFFLYQLNCLIKVKNRQLMLT